MRRTAWAGWIVAAGIATAATTGCGRSGRSGSLPGLELVYAVDWPADPGPSGAAAVAERLEALAGLRQALAARLTMDGFADERGYLRSREERVVFRIVDAKREDAARIKERLAPPLTFEVRMDSPEALLTCSDIARARRKLDPDAIRDEVTALVDFKPEAADRLAELTGGNVGRTIRFLADDVVVYSGRITEAITGGSVRLTFGSGTPEELVRKVDVVLGLIAACTSGVRLRQPPVEERWTAP